jgi:hypothetical protein
MKSDMKPKLQKLEGFDALVTAAKKSHEKVNYESQSFVRIRMILMDGITQLVYGQHFWIVSSAAIQESQKWRTLKITKI